MQNLIKIHANGFGKLVCSIYVNLKTSGEGQVIETLHIDMMLYLMCTYTCILSSITLAPMGIFRRGNPCPPGEGL